MLGLYFLEEGLLAVLLLANELSVCYHMHLITWAFMYWGKNKMNAEQIRTRCHAERGWGGGC